MKHVKWIFTNRNAHSDNSLPGPSPHETSTCSRCLRCVPLHLGAPRGQLDGSYCLSRTHSTVSDTQWTPGNVYWLSGLDGQEQMARWASSLACVHALWVPQYRHASCKWHSIHFPSVRQGGPTQTETHREALTVALERQVP